MAGYDGISREFAGCKRLEVRPLVVPCARRSTWQRVLEKPASLLRVRPNNGNQAARKLLKSAPAARTEPHELRQAMRDTPALPFNQQKTKRFDLRQAAEDDGLGWID